MSRLICNTKLGKILMQESKWYNEVPLYRIMII
jgi:hypothetical protein